MKYNKKTDIDSTLALFNSVNYVNIFAVFIGFLQSSFVLNI